MVLPASERPRWSVSGLTTLLAPAPGRMEFSVRLAIICALTTLIVEIYQTPEPALTIYLAFFVIKPDRASSVIAGTMMLFLITLIIGVVLLITMQVIDQPLLRVAAMASVSFGLLFLASASKFKPIAGIIALITAYALDLLGTAHGGEIATRALLYAWLFLGIPASVGIVVNLLLGPPPRRLAERALAHRLHLCARLLHGPNTGARRAFEQCLREGLGPIPAWLKLAGAEKTSPALDMAALQQAAQSTAVIMSMMGVFVRQPEGLFGKTLREKIAQTLEDMAVILRRGGYSLDVALENLASEPLSSPLAAAVLAELEAALIGFAVVTPPEASAQPAEEKAKGFFIADAFSNPVHVQHAIKVTAAAMFCYVVYSLLDWPGIHTCLITCYIVSLGTTAETIEKLTLRILGCLVGAGAGIAAIVFLMPNVTSIGALMALVFFAALVSGWVAAGSPRISYIGFQIAFAFFLSVVQGSAPAFDMTVARDRVIGILFGNVVVALVFTLAWPMTLARRIDPALAKLLRRLGAMLTTPSQPRRWALAAETQAAIGAIEQDIELTRYEPISIRPAPGWLDRRRHAAQALALLQGLLLVGADHDPEESRLIAQRLLRLADDVGPHEAAGPTKLVMETSTHQPGLADEPSQPGLMALVDALLRKVEQAIAQPPLNDVKGGISDARA